MVYKQPPSTRLPLSILMSLTYITRATCIRTLHSFHSRLARASTSRRLLFTASPLRSDNRPLSTTSPVYENATTGKMAGDGKITSWASNDGSFKRQTSSFRDVIEKGGKFEPEKGEFESPPLPRWENGMMLAWNGRDPEEPRAVPCSSGVSLLVGWGKVDRCSGAAFSMDACPWHAGIARYLCSIESYTIRGPSKWSVPHADIGWR